ncbi:glutamyl-tRNA reductase [Gammaproteobacteria bacterium]|nr:glutamyl-tRNA reductase [Gammaproteobacteria bacterium]
MSAKDSLPVNTLSENVELDIDEHEPKNTKRNIEIIFVMELQLFGINHKTTKLSERELFIINDSNQEDFKNFFDSSFNDSVESFFSLSTCNRTEVYVYGASLNIKQIAQKTLEFFGSRDYLNDDLYFFNGNEAFEHMCYVASGLDSQVLGEQEILGQFKQSIQTYIGLGSLNGPFQKLTEDIISIAKAARTETQIGFNPLSVSGLSLKIVQEIFEDPTQQKLTIVGAGQMAMSVIENFFTNGITNINAVNRSKKTLTINNALSIETTQLSQLGTLIQNTDILVTSINSPLPIVGKGLIEQAMRERKNKPMLLIDLGVPRNIENQVRDLEYAYLFTIEDIELVTQENLEERSSEALKARDLIQQRIESLIQEKANKKNRNEAYIALKNVSNNLDEQDFLELLNSDDPCASLKQMNVVSEDQLQYISTLTPHAVLSMIKEIRSA